MELECVRSEERLVGEAMEVEVDKFEKEKIEDVKVSFRFIKYRCLQRLPDSSNERISSTQSMMSDQAS